MCSPVKPAGISKSLVWQTIFPRAYILTPAMTSSLYDWSETATQPRTGNCSPFTLTGRSSTEIRVPSKSGILQLPDRELVSRGGVPNTNCPVRTRDPEPTRQLAVEHRGIRYAAEEEVLEDHFGSPLLPVCAIKGPRLGTIRLVRLLQNVVESQGKVRGEIAIGGPRPPAVISRMVLQIPNGASFPIPFRPITGRPFSREAPPRPSSALRSLPTGR